MAIELIIQQFLNALGLGIMYALIAVGFTLFFGVIEVVNFAHGEVFMLGAFVALLSVGLITSIGLTMGSLLFFFGYINLGSFGRWHFRRITGKVYSTSNA